jgi:hypothetical protein
LDEGALRGMSQRLRFWSIKVSGLTCHLAIDSLDVLLYGLLDIVEIHVGEDLDEGALRGMRQRLRF